MLPTTQDKILCFFLLQALPENIPVPVAIRVEEQPLTVGRPGGGEVVPPLQTKTSWRPYVGGGIGIHFVSSDNSGPSQDNSNTATGGHLIVGGDVLAKGGSRFFTELKLGFSNSPDFKVAAGFNFAAR